jgi:DNA-binding MarR family transcriptional regulator
MIEGLGSNVFVRMWGDWERIVFPSLARQDPGRVIRFLELSGREEGISQSELMEKLKISQPTLSKLTAKLERAELVVRKPAQGDGRICLTLTSSRGKRFLADLDGALNAELPRLPARRRSPKRLRGVRPSVGQQEFVLGPSGDEVP